MSKINKPQTLKGFQDLLPAKMVVRNYIKNILIQTFEKYGFQPLETPTLEYASTLMGKYGDEADKLVYSFTDKGDRQIGMRYDLTVPVSKVLSIYQNDINLPFKRYQIQPVWRADKPQKGRYREFTQCDIDTFGTMSPINDAEVIAVIYTVLKKLNFKKFTIAINSRSVLYEILKNSGINENQNSALQSIDKLLKIGKSGVTTEMLSKGYSEDQINNIFNSIDKATPDDYLNQVFEKLELMGVSKDFYKFDPTMVRGLDYYTGPIFETYVEEPKIGSITGGGRYDNLIESLGGPKIAAVGTSLCLDRLTDCVIELNLIPEINKSNTKIMIASFSPQTQDSSLKLITALRESNINSIIYPQDDKLGKQFKYASNLSIPYVAIIGPDEAQKGLISLKNMQTTEQKIVNYEELLSILSNK